MLKSILSVGNENGEHIGYLYAIKMSIYLENMRNTICNFILKAFDDKIYLLYGHTNIIKSAMWHSPIEYFLENMCHPQKIV